MKRNLIIFIIFSLNLACLCLVACNNDTVTIDKTEYNKLKGITVVEPKRFSVDGTEYRVYTGSDGHEYYGFDTYARGPHWLHYPDCNRCKQKYIDLMDAIKIIASDTLK